MDVVNPAQAEVNEVSPAQAEYERYRVALAKQLEKDEAYSTARNADLESVGTEMNRLLREQARLQHSKEARRSKG